MKDKTTAGILALLLGGFGVHRFYLGQSGLGMLHLLFFWTPISWIIGLISAISFFMMNPDRFNYKYNRNIDDIRDYQRRPGRRERYRDTDYDRRYREYQTRKRQERKRESQPAKPAPSPRPVSKPNPHKKTGINFFKEYDYDQAIEEFKKSLEIEENDIATHFNIACAYSINEKADEAFFHLDRAVELGFNDFNRIKNHDSLAYLRIQDEFDNFEANGFRLVKKVSIETPKEDLLNTEPELLEQLKKLAELREQGLLTELEFIEKKKKLLA